jgi:hypothetical protein
MRALLLIPALLLAGCNLFQPRPPEPGPGVPTQPVQPTAPQEPTPQPQPAQPRAPPVTPAAPALPVVPPPAAEPAPVEPAPLPFETAKPIPVAMPWLKPAAFAQLPGWRDDDMTQIGRAHV